MMKPTIDDGKPKARMIRDKCRLIAEKQEKNPRFWKSVFESASRGVGLKITTIRRLIYSSDPKIRYSTSEKMDRILKTLDDWLKLPGYLGEAAGGAEGKHRIDYELIEGVMVKVLRLFPDARGYLMEILRSDDVGFFGEDIPFGQAYVTSVYPGVVKAWHAHRNQTDRFCCVSGTVRLVLYDDRPDSHTLGYVNQFILGNLTSKLVLIPAGVQHGFAALGIKPAVVLNIPTNTYDHGDPDEQRLDPHDNHIPFDWNRIDG